ncbi:uncharacterized protein JCM15063_003217 [Sporobolomyces koalae]|uniref:uncharacterized protein n=1 Tax=Sporobolomyces koalae TaxID=500713 RepID=UPI00317204B4
MAKRAHLAVKLARGLTTKALTEKLASSFSVPIRTSGAIEIPSSNRPIQLSLHVAAKLPPRIRSWIWELFEANMKSLYENSQEGWDPAEKRKELFHSESRFIVASSKANPSDPTVSSSPSTSEALLGYTIFRFDTEETATDEHCDVVYCYELQIDQAARATGIGRLLTNALERIGHETKMDKVMLTVFKANEAACAFYAKIGFEVDEIDPSEYEDADEVEYRILSKPIHLSPQSLHLMSSPQSPSSSAPAQTSNATTIATPSPPTSASPNSASKPSKPVTKPKKRARKPLRRRGAKAADEDGEEDSVTKVAPDADDSSSESDFDPDSGREDGSDDEDEAEEEDDDDDEEEDAEPKTPANGHSSPVPTKFDDAQNSVPVAWSDMPQDGEAGSNSLPELDFANLSVSQLDALPTSTNANKSKKQLALQKRLEKSEELRQKDPEAWERQEAQRKEREDAKRLVRKERQREKNKAKKAANREKKEAETATRDQPSSDSTKEAAPEAEGPTPSTSRPTPAKSARPPRGPRALNGAPPVDYTRAREAYTQRLAEDPAYIPKVGRFWGHDDRLASPEVRPLNPFWRGRGGAGPRGGTRGAFRGGRGGFAQRGPDRWTAEGKVVGDPDEESKGTAPVESEEAAGAEDPRKELDPADKWGRGESKRAPRPSEFAAMPGWNHAGFEELEREEEERVARGPSPATRGGARGGRGGARGRGGFAGRGGIAQGPPGSINPRYAHLPFHPLHRFPAAVSTPAAPKTDSAPAPPSTDSVQAVPAADPAAPEPVPAQDSTRPVTRRLASSGASAAHFALALKGATESRIAEDSTAEPPVQEATEEIVPSTSPSVELRKQQGASILYAADPTRAATAASREDTVSVSPVSSFSTYQQQQQMAYLHHLPPHLQSQSPSAPFIPRHSSPAFYPAAPPPGAYYTTDAYPSPSSATPPPQLFTPPAPSASFFLPPRSSKIEIKAPSRDGDSPAPPKQAVISTTDTAYAIASQQSQDGEPRETGEGFVDPSDPGSHYIQDPPQYHYAYSHAQPPSFPGPYDYSQSHPHYQHPAQQAYYPPAHHHLHQQQQQQHYPYPQQFAYYPQQDPAILAMANHQYHYSQEQQQQYGSY